ncbi:MAG: hypothetical protein NC548_53580, partial [Lachnospiraceae bacterium]|nr:hypothetical protein [Lachnospiraceae bacterium]
MQMLQVRGCFFCEPKPLFAIFFVILYSHYADTLSLLFIYLKMKLLAYILTFILCSLGCSAFAATPEQMEQGRAIAIKYCLRDLNNYSDYLDKLNPKTVSELEKKLKDTEKENIKKLKNIQLPDEKDYSAWDKAQFKKYWAGSFTAKANLKSKGFTESKIVASLDKMTVTKKEVPKPDDVKQ